MCGGNTKPRYYSNVAQLRIEEFMTKTNPWVGLITVSRAHMYALSAHAGQYRDDGKTPYIMHPIAVYEIIKTIAPGDFALQAAALLHDTIEDTNTIYDDLVNMFGVEIADLVNEVTHEGSPNEVGYYFPRLHTQRGIMLKFADRLSNLADMDSWNEKRKQHYLNKSKFWNEDGEHGKR